jgi:hypothetical protein
MRNVESGLQEVTGSLARCVARVLLLHHFVVTAAWRLSPSTNLTQPVPDCLADQSRPLSIRCHSSGDGFPRGDVAAQMPRRHGESEHRYQRADRRGEHGIAQGVFAQPLARTDGVDGNIGSQGLLCRWRIPERSGTGTGWTYRTGPLLSGRSAPIARPTRHLPAIGPAASMSLPAKSPASLVKKDPPAATTLPP